MPGPKTGPCGPHPICWIAMVVQPRGRGHARPDRVDQLREPTPRGMEEVRLRVPSADRPRVSWPIPHEPTDPARSTILWFTQSFFDKAWPILRKWTQSFCYSELNHFATVDSVIFCCNELSHFSYNAQSFFDFVSHFVTVNSVIFCYSV
jgi:hypothetical protein